MDKSKTNKEDDDLRKLFAGTSIRAEENLKYRIMQQIETESVLVEKKAASKKAASSIRGALSVMGVMYALIFFVCISIFMTEGIESLTSFELFIPVIMIALVCGVYLIITVLDDKRRGKELKIKN